jgi:hypothetical protein
LPFIIILSYHYLCIIILLLNYIIMYYYITIMYKSLTCSISCKMIHGWNKLNWIELNSFSACLLQIIHNWKAFRTLKSLLDVRSHSIVEVHWRFRRMYCLYFLGWRVRQVCKHQEVSSVIHLTKTKSILSWERMIHYDYDCKVWIAEKTDK